MLLFFAAGKTQATHITGGTLTYTQTGSNLYNITLLLHFDEVNGNPGAVDPVAGVAAYNAGSGQFISSLALQHTSTFQGPCVPQCGYCVTSRVYTTTASLQAPAGAGIKLVFERCCRSSVIQNIPNPGEQGIYLFTVIPETANSSAVISDPLPPVLFQNISNTFSAAATDADGDELHYRLDNLYYGTGTPSNPIPAQPGFAAVAGPWAPGYSSNNMIGGPQPLQIDFNTGQISTTPGTTGYFQIAYSVEEHRNGQVIGTTRNEATVFVTEPSATCLVSAQEQVVDWAGWSVSPNPFADQIAIQLPTNFTAEVTAELLSSTGQMVVQAHQVQIESGTGIIKLNNSLLPCGLYLLRVSANGQNRTFRLVRQAK